MSPVVPDFDQLRNLVSRYQVANFSDRAWISHQIVSDAGRLLAEVDRLRTERSTPAPVEHPTDRELLVAVRRWARANGWHPAWHGWADATPASHATTGVSFDPFSSELRVWRRGDGNARIHYGQGVVVTSVRQAVDLLVALEILPAHLSTAYRVAVAERPVSTVPSGPVVLTEEPGPEVTRTYDRDGDEWQRSTPGLSRGVATVWRHGGDGDPCSWADLVELWGPMTAEPPTAGGTGE